VTLKKPCLEVWETALSASLIKVRVKRNRYKHLPREMTTH
jgi:hypothetical protein